MRPREMSSESVQAMCRGAREALLWCEGNAVGIAHRANCDTSEALKARTYDGVNRGGNDLTGPEAHGEAVLNGRSGDTIAETARAFQAKLLEVRRLTGELRDLGAKLLPSFADVTLTETQRNGLREQVGKLPLAEKAIGAGHCKVCTVYCSGARNDRLVSGRCLTCLQYWERHHRDEDRPRELWDVSAKVVYIETGQQ